MSCGYLFLEIAVNPIVVRMGPSESATQRLNFAHALYPIGVLGGLYVGRWVILSDLALPLERLGQAVTRPYMLLGGVVLVLAFVAEHAQFPAHATERVGPRGATREFHLLLSRPLFVAAIAAQFCNVAAQAGTWTLMTRYVQEMLPEASASAAADFLLASLIIFGVGRFLGALLMLRFDPARLLALFAVSGVVLCAIATSVSGAIGIYAVVASSFSVSIMFATILGLAVRDLGPLTKTGTALIYMGGAGSAIGVMAMHLVWTVSSIQLAMLVPTLGFAGVLAFALYSHKAGIARCAEPLSHAAE
jgi:FHS family L-fucose permease-like MFS transporter